MDPSTDLFFASITELNAKLKAREFSAVELTRAFCDRLEKLGPGLNALALSLREPAIRRARDVDDDIKRDRFRGPLQGIPFGAKDLLAVEGQITTWGAKPFAAQTTRSTATVLRRLNKAGAILCGKLAMVELAGGGGYRFANASLFGPGVNPWDRTRWSGGSSSGSGSAVAAGLVPFALGSETSGSIVTPAAFCGVTGLRPTYGLVSRVGAMPLSWTLDKIGPMCRTAEDCGLVLAAISGGDGDDPGSAGKSYYYAPQFARPLADVRIGYHPADFAEWPDPSARAAFRAALEAVTRLGATMVEAELPDLPYGPIISTIITAEGVSVFEDLIETGQVDSLADSRQAAGLRAGYDIPARDYLKAMRARRQVQDALRTLMMDIDILLAPARTGPAPKISEPLDKPRDVPQPKSRGLQALIPAANLAGMPALCLPCGFAEPGNLPVGIQMVGRPFTENLLLAVGNAFQKLTDFHRRRPGA
jgi:aspartyl-tRNA(Asn)/glutamyl-tRNA(Gln) amidotransferase subunit A